METLVRANNRQEAAALLICLKMDCKIMIGVLLILMTLNCKITHKSAIIKIDKRVSMCFLAVLTN